MVTRESLAVAHAPGLGAGSAEMVAEPVHQLGVRGGSRGRVVALTSVVEEGVAGVRVAHDLVAEASSFQCIRGGVPTGVDPLVLLGVDAQHGGVGGAGEVS